MRENSHMKFKWNNVLSVVGKKSAIKKRFTMMRVLCSLPLPGAYQKMYFVGKLTCEKVLSLDEMESIDYTMELPVPELEDKSDIIDTEHITELYKLVPPRAYSHSWKRIYSTNEDGFNLRTLYRKNSEYDCPVIIFVKNTKDEVFGAFLSVPLRQSDSFYGTGESFLFTFQPTFKEFKWTGQNDYFIKGNSDSISIGASEGHFGLWLDGDLYRGRSVRCQTFDNDPLASSDDFIVKILEAWVFT